MGRAVAQVPALMVWVTVVPRPILVSRAKVIKAIKAIRVVTSRRTIRGVSGNMVIKLTRSS